MAEEKEIARQNLINVTAEEKERKISALKADRAFSLKSFLPVSDNCHFERYNFSCGKEKLSIVYDTKANLFTLTALNSVLDKAAAAMNKPPVHKKNAQKKQPKPQPPKAQPKPQQSPLPDMPLVKPGTSQLKTKAETVAPKSVAQNNNTPKQKAAKQKPPKQKQQEKKQQQQQKLSARALKSLRKLVPDAFDLLGEQSKTDLGIGMTDIGNSEVKLSDYSVLLVPPYRGLERFIYDLQLARGITVKMIGQAYEKDESGKHVLKSCYRRKNGVVYSEVMSALYIEYFEKRNFYAHSDNSASGSSRVIESKDAAKAIFDNLCEIIDYNGKKLKEIGFIGEKHV